MCETAVTAKHTPGPWRLYEQGHKTFVVAGPDPEPWSSAGFTGDLIAVETTAADTLANLRLIAAAPELLSVCQLVVSECESDFIGLQEMSIEWRAIYSKCQDAIAKAKGEA